jgi:cob(I)alamin adenosyltransferase
MSVRGSAISSDAMVVLNRIYTRSGDDGLTGLATGERRPKFDLRIDAYGTVDETNACLGLARLHAAQAEPEVDAMLGRIQNDLFDLGADLATPETDKPLSYEPLRITQGQVDRLEREIDALNASLSPLRSFVLPGGSAMAAALHLARTVCRRAERLVVELTREPGETVSPAAVKYLNRLSDFLFVASRYVNDKGGRDVLWVPGQNR